MAVVVKSSKILLVEFTTNTGTAALNWRIDNPLDGITRQQVYDVASHFLANGDFGDQNSSGINILKGSGGQTAEWIQNVQTVETNVVTTDLT